MLIVLPLTNGTTSVAGCALEVEDNPARLGNIFLMSNEGCPVLNVDNCLVMVSKDNVWPRVEGRILGMLSVITGRPEEMVDKSMLGRLGRDGMPVGSSGRPGVLGKPVLPVGSSGKPVVPVGKPVVPVGSSGKPVVPVGKVGRPTPPVDPVVGIVGRPAPVMP